MKSVLVPLAAFFMTFSMFCQSEVPSEKFRFYSVSLSPSLVFVKGETGLGIEMDAAFSKNKHLFKVAVTGGAEVEVCALGPCRNYSFASYSILYGREFSQNQSISLDAFAGVGYFYLKSPDPNSDDYLKDYTIGFPLQARIRFRASKKFNLGIHMGGNINGTASTFEFGPFFQWTPSPKIK